MLFFISFLLFNLIFRYLQHTLVDFTIQNVRKQSTQNFRNQSVTLLIRNDVAYPPPPHSHQCILYNSALNLIYGLYFKIFSLILSSNFSPHIRNFSWLFPHNFHIINISFWIVTKAIHRHLRKNMNLQI